VSNYHALARHPITGKIAMADYLDDSFGHHIYGVRFPGDETIYRRTDCTEVSLHEAGLEIVQMRAVLDQLLDDMGEDGLCVCQQAKDEARAAIEGEKSND
jgi:hypothetical protein